MGDLTWKSMPKYMSLETVQMLSKRIEFHCLQHNINEIYINLHGGEPLLYGIKRTKLFFETLESVLNGIKIHWGIQTNGLLLNKKWIELFNQYKVHLGLSLDGPAEVNDKYRVDHQGIGSYRKVELAVQQLFSDFGNQIFSGILAVIDIDTHPLSVYHHLKSLNPKAIDFLLPHGNWENLPPGKSTTSLMLPNYANWLIPIFDEWFDNDTGHLQIRLFEEIIEQLAGGPGRLETIGLHPVSLVCIAVNGDIEGVDTLKSIPGEQILRLNISSNNLDDVLVHPKYNIRQKGESVLSDQCRLCDLLTVCGGGYLPHRWSAKNQYCNPSIFCSDLTKLIRHINRKVSYTLHLLEQNNSSYAGAPVRMS